MFASVATSTKILVHRGCVQGVRVNGRDIRARSVVSNANLVTTITKLIDPEYLDPSFVDQTREVRLNNSSTQVYMALSPDDHLDESTGDLLFSSTAPLFRTDLLLSQEVTSRTFSFYYPKTQPQSPAIPDCVQYECPFRRLDEAVRQDYEAAKQNLMETTLDALEKYVPNCRERSRAHGSRHACVPFNTTPSIRTARVLAPSLKDWPSAEVYPSRFRASTMPAASALSCPAG